MKIKLIAAIGNNNAIGSSENSIPWNFHPQDMNIFSDKTKSESGIVVMGRKTYESLPTKYKPLKDRRNIIISSNVNLKIEGVEIYKSIDEVMEKLQNEETVWIIGGGSIYREFIEKADELHISHFDVTPEANIYFPEIDKSLWKEILAENFLATENSPKFTHKIYQR